MVVVRQGIDDRLVLDGEERVVHPLPESPTSRDMGWEADVEVLDVPGVVA